jgi:hypothetical protein
MRWNKYIIRVNLPAPIYALVRLLEISGVFPIRLSFEDLLIGMKVFSLDERRSQRRTDNTFV